MERENSEPRGADICPGSANKKSANFVPAGELTGKTETQQLTKADFEAARERLAGEEGPRYWRSLEELAGNPNFREQLEREFPKGASEWLGGETSRRGFLKLMSASMALAGLTACTKQPPEKIVP